MAATAPPRADAQLLLRDGIAAAQTGNKARARSVIRQVVAAEPANEVAWLWLANLAPEPAEAVECLKQILAINPDHKQARGALSGILVKAGTAAADAKDAAEARRLFADATALDPNSEAGWMGLAGVAESPQDAVRHLSRVLEINPQHTRAQQGLEHYHAVLGRWACPLCEALASGPSDRCGTCRAVVTLRHPAAFDGQTGADETAMARAIARLAPQAMKSPGGPAAFHLGLVYLNLARPAEAIKVFTAAALHPGSDATWKNSVRGLAEHWREADKMPPVSGVNIPPSRFVLLVDDSPTVRKLVSVALQPAGFRVVTVSCSEKVPAALEEHGTPDLFLIDIGLPGEDGFQLTKRLRGLPATAAVPVVFLTGKNGTLDRLRGRWAGAADYVAKPFQQKTLTDAVTKVLEAKPAP